MHFNLPEGDLLFHPQTPSLHRQSPFFFARKPMCFLSRFSCTKKFKKFRNMGEAGVPETKNLLGTFALKKVYTTTIDLNMHVGSHRDIDLERMYNVLRFSSQLCRVLYLWCTVLDRQNVTTSYYRHLPSIIRHRNVTISLNTSLSFTSMHFYLLYCRLCTFKTVISGWRSGRMPPLYLFPLKWREVFEKEQSQKNRKDVNAIKVWSSYWRPSKRVTFLQLILFASTLYVLPV